MEVLREEHAHRRLGFATDEIQTLIAQAGLAYQSGETLASQSHDLSVSLWMAEKPIPLQQKEM
jgi:hypothetical protein